MMRTVAASRWVRRFLVTAYALGVATAQAGDWSPREKAIWNLGSSYAFMAQCAGRGHVSMDPIVRLGVLYERAMSAESYTAWRTVYQRAIHERRIYTIAGDRWLPYSVDAQQCKDADTIAEMMNKRLQTGAYEQLPK
jgi:hypothetical protein